MNPERDRSSWLAERLRSKLLKVSVRELARGVLVTLTGEIDLATAPRAEEELRRVEVEHDLVVLDLRRVSFIESSGVRMMIAADQRLRAGRGRLVVLEGSSQVRRMLTLTGLTEHLLVVDGSRLPAGWPADDLHPLTVASGAP